MRKLGRIQRSAKTEKNKFWNLAIDIDKENCYFDKLARNLIKYGDAVYARRRAYPALMFSAGLGIWRV